MVTNKCIKINTGSSFSVLPGADLKSKEESHQTALSNKYKFFVKTVSLYVINAGFAGLVGWLVRVRWWTTQSYSPGHLVKL